MKTEVIHIDPEILGGTPVFKGTRVPIKSLFDNIEAGMSIDEFVNQFPSVKKKQVMEVLEIASKLTSSVKAKRWYEVVT